MKKSIRKFSLILPLILLLQFSLSAQNDNDNDNDNDNRNSNKKEKFQFTRKKAVNKSYTVSSADKLDIQNSFGPVEIHTWDRNEIKVDVSIEVSANSESFAQKVLDRIEVSDDRSGNNISFKTTVKNNGNSNGGKSTMTTSYMISMPSSNALKIVNEFGNIIVPDFKGEADFTSKFGKITTGNLSNVKNINVEFGKANLGNIPGGSVNIKYSGATISRLSGSVKINLEFSNSVVLSLDNNLTSLDVKASYSSVNLKPLGDLAATYTVSTSFGSFKNKTAVKFNSDEEDDEHGPKFDHEYSGKSGNGNVPVKVKSNFSIIILGDATEDELKGKDKEKNKNKSKTVTI